MSVIERIKQATFGLWSSLNDRDSYQSAGAFEAGDAAIEFTARHGEVLERTPHVPGSVIRLNLNDDTGLSFKAWTDYCDRERERKENHKRVCWRCRGTSEFVWWPRNAAAKAGA